MQHHSHYHSSGYRRRRLHLPPPTIVLQPGEVAFRVLCHDSIVGGLIGPSGSVISQIRRETGCLIRCQDLVRGSEHRAILIVGPASPGRRMALKSMDGDGEEKELASVAQEAVIKVCERMWEVDAQSGGGVIDSNSEGYCGLLADTTQIGAVVGRGGKNVVRMRRESGAQIRILPAPLWAGKEAELIQITGDMLAVKRALLAVTECLHDCPSRDKDPVILARPVEKASNMPSSNPHAEFFPHLSPLLPPLTGKSPCSQSLSSDADEGLEQDMKTTQQEVSFRLLCSNGAAGSIIGKRGSIVRTLQNETGASITFAPPITMSGDRIVTISALENLESWYSPAQNAVILVFARSVEHDIEKGCALSLVNGTTVIARLLVSSNDACCLDGNSGGIYSEITRIDANMQILEGKHILDSALENDVVIEITGGYKNVQNALFLVTGKLRDNLLPIDMLNVVRTRKPHAVTEFASPRMQQAAVPSLNSNQETSSTRGMDQLGLSSCLDDFSAPTMQSQQITGDMLAVKRALLAVTECLHDCPPRDKDPVILARPVEKASNMPSSDTRAELFPHLSPLLPPLPGKSPCSQSLSSDADEGLKQDMKTTQQEVSFRLLCSNGAAGFIIGKRGSIVRTLQNETGASITFAPAITMSGDRIVTISSLENLESWYSPAQNAVILVFARSVEHDIEKGCALSLVNGTTVIARLLVSSNDACCLDGNSGGIYSEITRIGANMQKLEGKHILDSALENDVVIEITGEYKNVQNALFLVTGKLRDNLFPIDMLNVVRTRKPHGVMETASPRMQQAAALSLDSNQETSSTRGMDQPGLSSCLDDFSAPTMQSQQITGDMLAVKKALLTVTESLHDCPPRDKDPVILARPVEKAFNMPSSDKRAEIFPHLSPLLPPLPGKSPWSQSLSSDADEGLKQDMKTTQREVSFRLLCSNGAAGSIIGKRGSIVRTLQNETGASITFAPPITMSGERIVTISALENLESRYSPAQNAVILVFARSVEHDIEKGCALSLVKVTTVIARLLMSSNDACCFDGNSGGVDSEITRTGANMRILEGEHILDSALENDVVIEITGEYKNVQNALFLVTGKLRDNLLPIDMLNVVRTRKPHGVMETTSRIMQQAAVPSLDCNQETSSTTGMDQLGLSSRLDDASAPTMQSQQTKGRGSAPFGGTAEPERKKSPIVANTIFELVIPEDLLGSVYGKDGSNLARLRQISGAKVEVRDPSPSKSERMVLISGTPDQTMAAQSLLQAFILDN